MNTQRPSALVLPQSAPPPSPPSSSKTSHPKLLFRIVGHHVHRAIVGGHTFSCARENTTTEGGPSFRWLALKDATVLKSDCPTLNAAKKLCRAAASEELPSAN
jgi:hypothetical protein